MSFDLLLIACHTLFKLGIEIKIIIVIIKMSDTYRNEKLYAQFFAAFVTVFVVLTKLLHCLEIKLFINEGRYITFKFPAVQKHSFRIIAYINYFTSKRGKNTENKGCYLLDSGWCRQAPKNRSGHLCPLLFFDTCRQWDSNPHTVARGRF